MCEFLNWAQPHCLANSNKEKIRKKAEYCRFYESDCG
jgi:hypothetical protein